ncbi:hypothetical protein ACIPL1_24875 [Pseudomonas sp. NPDC090202]|uniref:hypothetical protein n=1 Tax=Pseudomonas sp. NPDC090202 TaxID=3364476 RepID=UPI003822BFAE
MKFTSLFMSAVLSALCLPFMAYAATPAKSAPKVWQQEPKSFLGLTFESASVAALPQCRPVTLSAPNRTEMCREESYSTDYYSLDGLPSLGLAYHQTLGVKVAGAQVEYFYLSGSTNDFEKVRQLFTEKYGPPTSSAAPVVKTKVGATFTNDTLTWQGSTVQIVLERYSDDINTFGASINNLKVTAAKAGEAASELKSNASKL